MAEIINNAGNQFSISGDLGFVSIPDLLGKSIALFDDVAKAEIDLKDARALDSSAVALLVEWTRQFEMKGGQIVFSNVPDQFLRIAQISDVDSVLKFSELIKARTGQGFDITLQDLDRIRIALAIFRG